MGRKLSAARADALVSHWAGLLRGAAPSGRGVVGKRDALAALIGLDARELTPQQASRLTATARELAAYLRGPADAQDFGRGSEPFEAWIHRRFVALGPDLALPHEQRRASLALLRDQDRRAHHLGLGRQAARIEMRAGGSKKLKKLKLEWGLTSLGATIEQLLALNGKAAHRGPKGGSPPRGAKKGLNGELAL